MELRNKTLRKQSLKEYLSGDIQFLVLALCTLGKPIKTVSTPKMAVRDILLAMRDMLKF